MGMLSPSHGCESKCALYRLRLAGDDDKISAYRTIRARSALLPISNPCRRETKPTGKFILAEPELTTQPLHVDLGRHMDYITLGISLSARYGAGFLGSSDQPLAESRHGCLHLNFATLARTDAR